MSYTITEESLVDLDRYWHESRNEIKWQPLFIIPPWLGVWLEVFAPLSRPSLLVVRQAAKIVGIAPLLIRDGVASIIGSPNVCDYLDFPIVPGKENDFYTALLDYLKNKGVKALSPGIVRPDSTVISNLVEIAGQSGYRVDCEPDEVSPEKKLPATWAEYLQSLVTKQRHEVRRKLRRLEEEGEISYRIITDPNSVPGLIDIFLKMFVESREDKATFLTPQINTFFRRVLQRMAEAGLLRMAILKLDDKPVAALVAFDYQDSVYLYNSGYDPQYNYLSVGIISKALLIKDSIERGKKTFDFLKGGEQYKYHLGGSDIQLQKCWIALG